MDWFEKITGFKEVGYAETQRLLNMRGGYLHNRQTDVRWAVGRLEITSLADLRIRAASHLGSGESTRVSCIVADARTLHANAAHANSLFQVASQFNLLEMVGPNVTPEDGVTRYQADPTQGPACAMAAGAATIFRNYRAPVAGGCGQRATAQIDCLAGLGQALGNEAGRLCEMRNGYALFTTEGLSVVDHHLRQLDDRGTNALRGLLRIGLHWQVDVTDMVAPGHRVSQAFCSALPVAYQQHARSRWAPFARLVLDAAYEATLLTAVLNRAECGNAAVFLTLLGGGAFGNDPAWIHAAIRRGLDLVCHAGLDVRIVSRGVVPPEVQAIADSFA